MNMNGHVPPSTTNRRFGAAVAVGAAIWVACAAGCTRDRMLARIDTQVDTLIREEQRQALGARAQTDSAAVPDTTQQVNGYTDAIVRTELPTPNPSASKLPVERREPAPVDENQPPRMLDHDAPSALALNLQGVLAFAIEHSREYRNEKEGLFLAAIGVLVERHMYSPRFFNTTTVEFSGTPERGDHDQVFDIINDLGVTQRLPYGGTITATATVNFVEMLRTTSDATAEGDRQSGELALTTSIPLLRGAGYVSREPLIQAERELIYAAREFERFRRSFFVNIATDYFDLVQQQSRIHNADRQYRSLLNLASRFEALADAGRQAYFEAEEAQQRALQARSDLVAAKEQYASSLDFFKVRLGVTPQQVLAVEQSEVVIPEPDLVMMTAVARSHEYRLDLQTQSDRVDDGRRGVANAQNALLPDADFNVTANLPTTSQKKHAGFDLNAGEGSYTAGVTLGAPLDRRIERLQLRSTMIDLERLHRSYTLLRDQITQSVRRAVRRIERARFDLHLQTRRVEFAKRQLTGAKLRERSQGINRVIDAEDALTNAENERDRALRDLRVNILQYLLETGQMRITTQGRWLPPAKLMNIPSDEQ